MAGWIGAVCASYGGVVRERGWAESVAGRSFCACGRQLRWFENVPVIGWVACRGVARCCRVRLPRRYVITEAASLVAGAATGAAFGPLGVVAGGTLGLAIAVLAP